MGVGDADDEVGGVGSGGGDAGHLPDRGAGIPAGQEGRALLVFVQHGVHGANVLGVIYRQVAHAGHAEERLDTQALHKADDEFGDTGLSSLLRAQSLPGDRSVLSALDTRDSGTRRPPVGTSPAYA